MSPTDLLVPTYTHMLQTLAGLLEKARQQSSESEAEALLAQRLAPDMLPLSAQVRFACLQAQEAVFRLKGQLLPQALEQLGQEGHAAGEEPGSMVEAQTRIGDALSFLGSLEPGAFDGAEDRRVILGLPGGPTFDMTGQDYVRDWALPQFYFHVVTAYAILRSRGIEIGKADYVPHMFNHLRSPTAA